MSSIEKRLEAQWLEINEHERSARARFDEMSDRDFNSRPWTDEDHESIRIMIQWMTSQLARKKSMGSPFRRPGQWARKSPSPIRIEDHDVPSCR